MPTIFRDGPYRFFFFSHEPNEPPHVHVERGERSLKVWLDAVAMAKSQGFRGHEINATPHGGIEPRPPAGGMV
jgi:hypothetical protein